MIAAHNDNNPNTEEVAGNGQAHHEATCWQKP
jgi:hypothetical protein